jgi:nucleoside phosphorylase
VLKAEATAARIMLDEEHGTPRTVHPQDTNSYVLGRIGPHNVVIACLPAGVHGQTSAATVVTQLRYTFSSLRFGLLVGIGGGVPTAGHDVRLGDVVVSRPCGTSGGVVQYDAGELSRGNLIRRGTLNKPPAVLLTAVANLSSAHMLQDNRIEEFLDVAARRFSKARALLRRPPAAAHLTEAGADADRLYRADYVHVGDEPTCDQCSDAELVARPSRDSSAPEVHYGTIASGHCMIVDATRRDSLARALGGVLCFEMEAAGLMDGFSCLVIRGICGYADSHQNDESQGYAAGAAAAYAKELLGVMPEHQVMLTSTIAETMEGST